MRSGCSCRRSLRGVLGWLRAAPTTVSVPEGHGMILIESCVVLGDTTYRVTYLAWTLEELGVLRGERDDRLVRRADAGRVRQGCDRRDAARATAGGGGARGPAGRSGHDAAGTRHRRGPRCPRLPPPPPPTSSR